MVPLIRGPVPYLSPANQIKSKKKKAAVAQ
jgi:hypothetical protein